jgi:hypothetical protein
VNDGDAHKIWYSTAETRERLAADGDQISQPGLTQYLNRFPEIPRRQSATDARVTEIDFEALVKHRAENVRTQDRQAAAPRRNPEAEALQLRERRAGAELKEFQLAERRGELVPRAEVVRAVQAAAVALTQSLQRSRFERAEALEGAAGVRGKTSVLITQDEAALAAFADALTALAGAGANDDGDSGDAADAGSAAESEADD